jgi:FKBP-type peptidyl-prolyl cis-trans isomerase FkpA
MYIRTILTCLLVFCLLSANAQRKMETTPKGLRYIKYTNKKGDKAQLGDEVSFHYIITNAKDSQLFNSYKIGQEGTAVLYYKTLGNFADGFQLLANGDSIDFFVSSDSMLKNQQDPSIQPGTLVKYTFKITNIKTASILKKESEIMEQMEVTEMARILKAKYPKAQKTASGLYYVIRKEGTGPAPQKGMEITAHYKGTFTDGHMFDTDSGKATPFKFKLGEHQVIPGWDEGFALLKKGTKATFIIPSKLAYGPKGYGKVIRPFSILIFDVELVDAKAPATEGGNDGGAPQNPTNPAAAKEKENAEIQKYIKEKAPNAKKTASGLYYVIETEGTGPVPQPGQTVIAHYTGSLLDGKEFDSDRGATFKFPLGQHRVIAGWDEGFALLKKGSKAKLIIPYELAYGEHGAGGVIPPFAPLVFEVELVDIQ